MELLGAYGSGSDSEPDSPRAPDNAGRATLLDSDRAEPPAAQQPPANRNRPLTGLPAPSSAKAPLFSGLPKPAAKKKLAVQFRCPITFNAADVKEDAEQEPAAKRRKAAPRGLSLSQLLPQPKNTAGPGGGQRLDLGGGGGRGGKYDSDDDELVPGAEDRSGMVDLAPGEAADAGEGNEAFRVDAAPAAAHPPQQQHVSQQYAVQYDAAQQQQHAAWQAYYAASAGHEYNVHQQAAAAAAAATAADPAEAMLAAALAAEREKAARRGRADSVAGIAIKEVRGDQLKHMDPGQRANVDAIRNALGADYEAKLRREAGAEPSKMAKRRHQIGSLYHQAKQQELEQLEVRAQGSKSRAETQRKYGW